MRIIISITTDNAAFQDDPNGPSGEVARILRDLAKRIDGHPHFSPGHFQPLRDSDGNEVGFISVHDSEVELTIRKPEKAKK